MTLPVLRFGPPGAFFALDAEDARPGAPTLLLPRAEVPEGTKEGDPLELFVYLDSEDRPIATTRPPLVELFEVAFMKVTDVTSFGAFVDWGLMKELLVPLSEQTRPMNIGERHAVGLFLDDTGRLCGTAKVTEMLRAVGDFTVGEWVQGEAWRNEEAGLFVIVEKGYVGRVPGSEPHGLIRGEAARFRITKVLPDGKIELSLRAPAHEAMEGDAEKILHVLGSPRPPKLGDKSTPDEIREAVGLSKKAFKRAAGRLLKLGKATMNAEEHLVKVTERAPESGSGSGSRSGSGSGSGSRSGSGSGSGSSSRSGSGSRPRKGR